MILWLAYASGLIVHWLAKSQAIVSTPYSPISGYTAWLVRNWPALLVRTFLSSAGFGIWYSDQAYGSRWLEGIPLTIYSAAIYGFLADVLLYLAAARFRWLDGEIPRYNVK